MFVIWGNGREYIVPVFKALRVNSKPQVKGKTDSNKIKLIPYEI